MKYLFVSLPQKMNVAMETYAITSSAYTLPTNKLIYHPLKNVTDNSEISSLDYNLEFLQSERKSKMMVSLRNKWVLRP